MKKCIFRSPVVFLLVIFLLKAANAAGAGLLDSDYGWSDEEGPWVVKGKLGGVFFPDITEQYFLNGAPIATKAAGGRDSTLGEFFDDSVHVEVEANYRWTDHISFAGAIGYQPYNAGIWRGTLTGDVTVGRLSLIPVSLTMQYNFAPFGQIRPYIGGGVHYSHVINTYDLIEVDPGSGLVFQAGADWWLQKQWGFNVEIKKMWFDTKIDFTTLTGVNLYSDLTVDPLILSVGLMHRF